MEALKKAEAELAFKKAEYDKQRHLVEDLKTTQLLPESIKKYQGKCFKERNSYGCGSDTEDWFIYYFVKKVTSYNYSDAITMQITGHGTFELEQDPHLPLSMCKNEISREEFLSAVSSFEQHIADTLKPCR